jgi:hypothetical protein
MILGDKPLISEVVLSQQRRESTQINQNPLLIQFKAILQAQERCEEKKSPGLERKLLFVYFMIVLVTWMSFAFIARELRRCDLTMLEILIMMSYLIFCLALSLTLHLTLLLMFCLISLMDLTIAHIILVHEITALCLNDLVTTHVLNVAIIFRICPVFLLEGLALTLSRDTWTVHIFPVVAHVPLDQMVRCKGL